MTEISAGDISIIRSTWARVAPVSGMASRLFYGRLFRIAPETRPLFAQDMTAQGRKLVSTLGFVVDHLDNPEKLAAEAAALAVRHLGYGVTNDQYAPVGEALVWMLGQLLGSAFGPREREAWERAYARLSAHMIDSVNRAKSEGRRG